MNQTNRTEEIDAILGKVDAEFREKMSLALEAYIARLEENQNTPQVDAQPGWDSDNPPVWSHERAMQRQRHRQERAWSKWKMRNDFR